MEEVDLRATPVASPVPRDPPCYAMGPMKALGREARLSAASSLLLFLLAAPLLAET